MNGRVEKYAEMIGRRYDYRHAAAIGLIQYAATAMADDAKAMAEIRDVLAGLDLANERSRIALEATIAAARAEVTQ